MDDSADAKKTFSREIWKRPPGRTLITLMKTVLENFKPHDELTSTEAVNIARNWLEAAGSMWCCE